MGQRPESTQRESQMPRIGVVDGLAIFIFREEGGKHKHPHFHLSGGGVDVSIRIDNCEVLQGKLPRNKKESVLNYWRRHQAEIQDNYDRLQRYEDVYKIED